MGILSYPIFLRGTLAKFNAYFLTDLKGLCFTKIKTTMSIVKVIEVIASSEKSIEDAIQSGISEVSKTVHNIDSVFVKDIKAHVKDGKVSSYGVICKVSFRVD